MRDHRSLRGFRSGAVAGVVIGFLIGSASVAAATFWIQGWQRFSDDFKVGYINGFLDMANLARNLEPGGWVDSKYPQIPQAKPIEWAHVINELYQDPANAKYSITSILQSAAFRLKKKYGPGETPDQRAIRRMQQQLEALRVRREKAGLPPLNAKTAATPPKVAPGAATDAKPAIAKEPAKKPSRKWCRCDGKDPKAARAARRAAAAKKEAEEAAKAPAAPATKTPPAAAKSAEPTPPAKKPETK